MMIMEILVVAVVVVVVIAPRGRLVVHTVCLAGTGNGQVWGVL